MIDREKVMADLRKFINYPEPLSGTVKDALELLKEQEPIKPIAQGDDSYLCDNCGETVGWEELSLYGLDKVKYKYCPECGRKVQWDADK